jgi:hypothetical protein
MCSKDCGQAGGQRWEWKALSLEVSNINSVVLPKSPEEVSGQVKIQHLASNCCMRADASPQHAAVSGQLQEHVACSSGSTSSLLLTARQQLAYHNTLTGLTEAMQHNNLGHGPQDAPVTAAE